MSQFFADYMTLAVALALYVAWKITTHGDR